MKISTKGRYALRMLLDLAVHQKDGFVALKDIAERQNVSKKYLEQIVPLLSRAGILSTSRGLQGGYRLTVPPETCTVGMILRTTEGNLAPVACLVHDPATDCRRSMECLTLPVWQGLDKIINQYLDGITLQDILEQRVSLPENNP